MMSPDASIVPYSGQNGIVAEAAGSRDDTNRFGVLGAMVRRNRTIAVNENIQELTVREEVIMMENNYPRENLERAIQESRQRVDDQGLMLDIRSQQLLNYTHEHVEQSRVNTERRLEERINAGIQTSHHQIQENVREHAQNLGLQIQEQLRADRQREIEEMETRFTHQSAQWQHAVEMAEQRTRADIRVVATAETQGWGEQLEGVKNWTQQYVDTSIQAHDETEAASFSDKMKKYVDERFIAYESHVEGLISANLREEKAAIENAFEDYTTRAHEDLSRCVDAKIEILTESHEKAYSQLEKTMETRIAGVEQNSTQYFADLKCNIERSINEEIQRAVAEQETKLAIAVQQHLQTERQKETNVLSERLDEAVEAAIHRIVPRIQLASRNAATASIAARQACIERRLNQQIAAITTNATTSMHENTPLEIRVLMSEPLVEHQTSPLASSAAKNSEQVMAKPLSTIKPPKITQKTRMAATRSNRKGTMATKQSRLEKVRAASIHETTNRAVERAVELERSHKMKTRSQKKQK